ncbi:hypothetical protein A3218_05550 [Pseudomonas chlororaphis]|uniref:F4 family fimbrial subunit n=1 Tax=Pseudomonas chlororaphis TaxID=587753 RepID=UPI000789E520|nr:hypothetical protein [Pseudomonas chlororaphis]AMS13787.1 hypothetical protein A3218_05550 [Pseudomonas chlororaphis]
MKTNKLYMAVAAVALGLSSHAMALTFTDGNLTGGVDIGGDIAVPVATNQWQWAAGDAISFPSIHVTQMTNSYKTLTLPATANLPLLVGQTKAATIGNAGNAGINPQIAFTDAAGATVTPVWENTGNTGKGTITLPVTAADGTTALGNMTMTVKVGALRAGIEIASTTATLLDSMYTGTATQQFYGQFAQPSTAAGVLSNGSSAAAWNAVLGAHSATDLLAQLNTAKGSNNTAWRFDSSGAALGFNTPAWYFSGTYGLGIAQGDDIVVNFTNPVTVTTAWKSALKATVTYL